jgi:hypothetical protein
MSIGLAQAENASAHQTRGAFVALFPEAIAPAPVRRDDPVSMEKADDRLELPLDELSFHRLGSAAAIARIMHLRDEIQLPAAALADPSFQTREKKETSTGL